MSTVFGLLITITVSMLISGIRRIRVPGYEAQLAPYGEAALHAQVALSSYNRWFRPLVLWLAGNVDLLRGLTNPQKVDAQLDSINRPGGMTADEFYGIQLCGTIAAIGFGLWFASLRLPLFPIVAIALPCAGFYLPLLWLSGKVKQRQRAISIALPDLLDMLAVCVSAGMGFDVALTLLEQQGEGPLNEEIGRLLHELHVGEPRDQAFRHLMQRNSAEELRVFVSALLQAEDLGTPIADVLERQAEDIRVQRRHKARAQGAKAATKISLVVVLLVMPSVLCFIIAALGLSIARNLGPFFDVQ